MSSIGPNASSALEALVAASREIGADPRLVLHGGGNASVKTTWPDVTGRDIPALFVSGSGHDLASIGADGFAPLRLDRLRELLPPTRLADTSLANELRCAMLDQSAPDPSVETLVHAVLPHAAVLHSHADAVLTITNTPDGAQAVRRIWGERILVVDYAMPGPALAAACQAAWQAAPSRGAAVEGIIVLNHGLFTFAETSRDALARHHAIIREADAFIAASAAAAALEPDGDVEVEAAFDRVETARLRHTVSAAHDRSMILTTCMGQRIAAFAARGDVLQAAQRGPLTPDHALWTGRAPLIGRDVEGYRARAAQEYADYARSHDVSGPSPTSAPKIILDGDVLRAAGRDAAEAQAAARIARHTMDAIVAAERLGGYRPADSDHIFDLECWPPQQEKLRRREGARRPLAGQVALVTGAASGIGRACAADLLAAGACVVGWDTAAAVVDAFEGANWHGIQVDVTDADAVDRALTVGVAAFGGLDIVVVAAGIFPKAESVGELDAAQWRRVMAVNVDSVAALFSEAHPLLRESYAGGRVVVIASKNVAAPGSGAAAYSSSKAALTQLSRVAAIEWARDGIRVNVVHPDAVFDTALWTPELLAARAVHYGVTVDEYKRRNMLGVEVTSRAVGALVTTVAGDAFACTTGAQIPIDGGNERVI